MSAKNWWMTGCLTAIAVAAVCGVGWARERGLSARYRGMAVAMRTEMEASRTKTDELQAAARREYAAGEALAAAAQAALQGRDRLLYGADLEAVVRMDGASVRVRNANSYTWVDAALELNPGILRRGHRHTLRSVEPGEEVVVAVREFTTPKGERFDPARLKVETVSISGKKPNGMLVTETYSAR